MPVLVQNYENNVVFWQKYILLNCSLLLKLLAVVAIAQKSIITLTTGGNFWVGQMMDLSIIRLHNRQCDQIGWNFSILSKLMVDLTFAKILNLFWNIFMKLGPFWSLQMVKYWKIILTIWSHWQQSKFILHWYCNLKPPLTTTIYLWKYSICRLKLFQSIIFCCLNYSINFYLYFAANDDIRRVVMQLFKKARTFVCPFYR